MADNTLVPSDDELLKCSRNGDMDAFGLLINKYQHRIVSLVSRYVSDHTEAQDVAQEAFIKAYRAMAKFRGDSAFYTWLYRVAINTAKNHLASQSRRPPGDDIEAETAEQMDMGGGSKRDRHPGKNGAAAGDCPDHSKST